MTTRAQRINARQDKIWETCRRLNPEKFGNWGMFTFISDPGHGWLEVSGADLTALGLNVHCFSRYSYRDPRRVGRYYLEEDCDAPKFLSVWQAKNGGKPSIKEVYQSRFNRNMPAIHD